jgi:CheY-like chemotaxis protein
MEASGPDQVARPGKILVMDDEEWLRNTLGTLLHKMGHEVELVEEGHRAIEAYAGAIAQRRPFDAVLLDLTIRGGMGGLDTIRALKQIDPAVKAIVMSGYTDDPVLHESQIHGFKAVLKKPFDSGHLQATLARLMTDAP